MRQSRERQRRRAHPALDVVPSAGVETPPIRECHASLEYRLVEAALVEVHDVFIFEVVRAYVAAEPEHPGTLHHTGDGVLMVSERTGDQHKLFRRAILPSNRESARGGSR